jgi:branched-chain amino acid transport system substrate-binding protein
MDFKKRVLVAACGVGLIGLLFGGAAYAQSYPGINAPWTQPGKWNYKGTIVIGDASDLTGPAGKSASEMSGGVADWFRYQNEYLGGVVGYKIESTVVDTKFDSQSLVNTINRFIDEGKPMIYSGVAYCVPATTEICNRRHMPILGSSGAVTQAIMDPEKEKTMDNYFFQMSPVVASRMAILVKFCLDDWKNRGKTGIPKFGTFNCDTQEGHEAATAARIYVNKLGAKFTIHTFHAPSITDAKAQVSALKKAGVDYILNGPDYDQPLTVFALEMNRMKDANWDAIFAGHTCWGTVYVETGNKALEGHYSYQYCLSWEDADRPIIAFLHKINQMWHPKVKIRPFLYQAGVQAGIVMCEAFKRAIDRYGDPKKLTGEQMRTVLEGLNNFDPQGISGPITYTRHDHQGVTSLRISQCKDRKLVGIGDFVKAQLLEPHERYGKYWLQD